MRRFLIGALIIIGAWSIAYLFAGRQFSLLVDRSGTVPIESLPTSSIRYDSANVQIGGFLLIIDRPGIKFTHGPDNRLVLQTTVRDFPLGPRPNRSDPNDPSMIEFVPDAGDQTSFTIDKSFLSWPTPFETNFMTGHVSSWRRHLYYRLRWKKRHGDNLKMVWRYEQWFYGRDGWTGGTMTSEYTGLIQCEIGPKL